MRRITLSRLLLVAFAVANLIVGSLYAFFMESLPGYPLYSAGDIQTNLIFGIICFCFGVILGIYISFPVLKRIAQFLGKAAVESKKIVIALLKWKKRKAADLEHDLLILKPHSAEHTLDLLNQLQEKSDMYTNQKNYGKAITFLQRKEEIYKILTAQLHSLKIPYLVDQTAQEMAKNTNLLYQLKHLEWLNRYTDFTQQLDLLKEQNNYAAIASLLKSGMDLVQERLATAQTYQIAEDISQFKSMLREYKNLDFVNNTYLKYKKIEEQYNQCIQLIERNALSEARTKILDFQTEISSLQQAIANQKSSDKYVQNLLNAITHLSTSINHTDTQIQQLFETKMHGLKQPKLEWTQVSAQVELPQISQITHHDIKSPVYAKVLLIGESSVGKTHLILSLTNQKYLPTQGSTIGVDEFYLPIKIPNTKLDPQLCFWDIGGQWNFRTMNHLFFNDASVIVLVYDITRPQTLVDLGYWLDMLKIARLTQPLKMILVGNKIDVGGTAINSVTIEAFKEKYQLSTSVFTSAKTGENIPQLLEAIVGEIDWSTLIQAYNPEYYATMALLIRESSHQIKIIKTNDLISLLTKKTGETDRLLIKSILLRYASQNLILFDNQDVFTILDPTFISKTTAECIRIAAENHGILTSPQADIAVKLNKSQQKMFFEYLHSMQVCFSFDKTTYIFPKYLGGTQFEISPYDLGILHSNPMYRTYKVKGNGDLWFYQFLFHLNYSIGAPKHVSPTNAFWLVGQGRTSTACSIIFDPTEEGGTISIEIGGGEEETLMKQVDHVLNHLNSIHSPIVPIIIT